MGTVDWVLRGVVFEHGGVAPGWLPPGAAIPPATPLVNVLCDLELQGSDAEGYLLICNSLDPNYSGAPYGWDLWYETLEAAEKAAADLLGVDVLYWVHRN